jgi:hypothetical protein
MRLLGYGEDALTLWALQHRLDEIMINLGDSGSNVLEVFFRPSFGRRSHSRSTGAPGPQFGEFDAIVVSSRGVYLVEAKWTGSGEVAEPTAVLRQEQLRRHRVFREYLRCWIAGSYKDWDAFAGGVPRLTWFSEEQLESSFTVAPIGSRLARNLEFVLRSCALGGNQIVDVLLVVHPEGDVRNVSPPQGFECVEVIGPPIDGYFVQLGAL